MKKLKLLLVRIKKALANPPQTVQEQRQARNREQVRLILQGLEERDC